MRDTASLFFFLIFPVAAFAQEPDGIAAMEASTKETIS